MDIFCQNWKSQRYLTSVLMDSGPHVIKTQSLFTSNSAAQHFFFAFIFWPQRFQDDFQNLSPFKLRVKFSRKVWTLLPQKIELKFWPQAWPMKEIIDKLDFIKIKDSALLKTISRQATA